MMGVGCRDCLVHPLYLLVLSVSASGNEAVVEVVVEQLHAAVYALQVYHFLVEALCIVDLSNVAAGTDHVVEKLKLHLGVVGGFAQFETALINVERLGKVLVDGVDAANVIVGVEQVGCILVRTALFHLDIFQKARQGGVVVALL